MTSCYQSKEKKQFKKLPKEMIEQRVNFFKVNQKIIPTPSLKPYCQFL